MQYEEPPQVLTVGEVRSRAATGAALLGARGAAIYALATIAHLVLARLLTPHDFGIFALGLVLVVIGTYLAEGGFGGALINREQAPTRVELEAVNALQLEATSLVVLVAAAVAIPLGRDAQVIALMSASLPLVMLRTPSVILLERRLEYRTIATADIVEAVVFYASALTAVGLGLDVWGLAIAMVVRGAAGSAAMIVLGPTGFVRPRWSWTHVRPLFGFGAKFQAAGIMIIGREQAVNVAVGAVGGLATLGVWSLAWRVTRIPDLLFQVVGRVSFPAISRLLDVRQDPAPVLQRQLATLAAINAVVVVGLVALAPALPVLIGDRWDDVPDVLLWSGVALIVAGPVVVTANAYLFAAGEPGKVAIALFPTIAVWLAVALPLLETLGPEAVAIGWVVGGSVNAALVWRLTARRTGARMLPAWGPITAAALAALATGWLVAHVPDERLLGAALGVAAAELVMLAGLMWLGRAAVDDVRALAQQALRS